MNRSPLVWQAPLRARFRGLDARDGLLLPGRLGWGEFAPFADYSLERAEPWLRAAREAADDGWPAPVRQQVPVNVTVPAVTPERAAEIVRRSGGCTTAKVKVAERDPATGLPEPAEREAARIGAVREAFDELYGPGVGRIRIDANGAWTVSQALEHLEVLDDAAGGLEYVEQPCAAVTELAELRARLAAWPRPVPVAADESIRCAADPLLVAQMEAADLVILKVGPLGGVRACLELAEQIGLPVVVSSALDSSIGLAAGLALAGALPELPYACGLATSELLVHDVLSSPLLPSGGLLPVLAADDPRLTPDLQGAALRDAPADLRKLWDDRLAAAQRIQEAR